MVLTLTLTPMYAQIPLIVSSDDCTPCKQNNNSHTGRQRWLCYHVHLRRGDVGAGLPIPSLAAPSIPPPRQTRNKPFKSFVYILLRELSHSCFHALGSLYRYHRQHRQHCLHVLGCLTPMEGLVSLPQEFFNYVITKNSPLAVLLPSTRGPGLCAYILLYYLLVQHNEFLHRYCKLTKQR